MYIILAVFAGIVGIVLAVSAATTAVALYRERKQMPDEKGHSWEKEVFQMLGHWTRFDYALLFVFVIGALFLLTDLLAVIRDRDAYPYYHFGYLASGFCYVLLSMLLMQFRLLLMLKIWRSDRSASTDQHSEPNQANRPE